MVLKSMNFIIPMKSLLIIIFLSTLFGDIEEEILEYYENGKIKWIKNYKEEKLTKYYPSGKKWYQGETLFLDRKDGVWTEWYESGKIKQIETYTNWTFNNPVYRLRKFSYYGNGKIKTEKEYLIKDDFNTGFQGIDNTTEKKKNKIGKWIYYSEEGIIENEYYYNSSGIIVQSKKFYEDGKLYINIYYIYSSNINKEEWIYYNKDGSKQKEETFKNGELIKTKEY